MKRIVKILIVVRRKGDGRHYCSLLGDWGAETIAAENSFDAIRLFNWHFTTGRPFDLIMTDYILPGQLTGISLAEIFTSIHPGLKVLFFPAAELYDGDVRQECKALGAHILKPDLSNRGLRQLIRNLELKSLF